MRIIDAHVHLYPAEVAQAPAAWAEAHGESHWARLCTRRRRDGRPVQSFPDAERMLRDMDTAGIESAVLQSWYWEAPATCAWQNRFYAGCIRSHPDRFAAFAAIHPGAGEAAVLEEIRRARSEGFRGLGELSPHSQGFAMDDPVWTAALALAGELGLAVNLHVTDPEAKAFPGRVITPLEDFRTLARRFPATKFILAHWGGGLPFLEMNAAVRRELANVHYDTAASPLIYDDRIWRTTLDVVAAGKVLFGSDYPLILYPHSHGDPGWLELLAEVGSAGLALEEKTAVLGGNAAALLGI